MEISEDKKVLEYRLNRIKNAPRNWVYWIAFFTLINGVFLLTQQDITFLAGAVFPFLVGDVLPHIVVAGLFGIAGYFWSMSKIPAKIALTIYFLDLLFCVYLQYWSGVAFHAVVFIFLLIANTGAKSLEIKISEKEI
jgi:hypothetical protein